ncbi:MAG: potassium transporter TrkA [Gammaproteobacteria bacterium]|nr:potassium transporter TrkA [Gammaproteobacteria bacterium]
MTKASSLILRRMRVPLLVLIATYSISVLGFVLVPGIDESGQRWNMTFFDAVYFVSYMATTIGFGELPQPFSAAQRMWTTISIYLSVIGWVYAIGAILSLVQNSLLKRALEEGRFTRNVKRLNEDFFIICGYGETARLLVHSLNIRGFRTVVIETNSDRLDDLSMSDIPNPVPSLAADASNSKVLIEAGLFHSKCKGVVALTDSDEVNLKIAISCRLLKKSVDVICRVESLDAEANMRSFSTDYIVNPFESFASRLAMALHSPSSYLINQWLTGVPGTRLMEPTLPPRGLWLLCGYGRFGKAIHRFLTFEGLKTRIIESDHELTHPPEGSIKGRGTEAVTLRNAGISDAVGIVAGTDNDTNNLSIVYTAKEQNKELFTVARQNHSSNEMLFQNASLDIVMQRSDIIAHEILSVILAPLLASFLQLVKSHGNQWSCELASRLIAIVGETTPDTWGVGIDEKQTPALVTALAEGEKVTVSVLNKNHFDREERLKSMVLMISREDKEHEDGTRLISLPNEDQPLQIGDQILFCSREGVRNEIAWVLNNRNALHYVLTGEKVSEGWLWRLFFGGSGQAADA